MSTNETKSDIPTYFRSLSLDIYIDSNGVVANTDTTGRWEMFVPPVPSWRNWKNVKKNLGYIPTQVVSVDTTYSGNWVDGGGKNLEITYRFEPTFSGTAIAKTKIVENKTVAKVEAKKDSPAVQPPADKKQPATKPAGKIIF